MFLSNLFSKVSSSEQTQTLPKQSTISFLQKSSIPTEDFSKYQQYHSLIVAKTEQIENDPNIKTNFLNAYFILEEELSNDLNKIKNNKNHKQILRETLYDQFFKYDTSSRLLIQKQINTYFNKYLSSINMQRDLKQYFQINFDDNNFNKNEYENTKLNMYLKEMTHGIIDECISYIMSNIPDIEQIPTFLINKKLIKQKVDLIWKINYSIPTYQLKLENSFAYKYLNQIFLSFSENKITLFPIEIYTKEDLGIMMDALFFSNVNYMQTYSKARNVFIEKLNWYLTILHLEQMQNDLKQKYISLINESENDYIENEKEKKFNLLKYNLISNAKVNLEKEGNEKVLLMILCFSFMLNNIVMNETKNQESKININDNLICSSIERKFLLNVLINIDKYFICSTDKRYSNSAIYVNIFIENMILKKYFKIFSVSLFDETLLNKIDLSQKVIMSQIMKSFQSQTNINYMTTNIKEKYISFINKFDNNGNSFIKLNDHFVNVNLIPSDPHKISNHITIVVSNKFDKAILNQLNSYNKNIDYYLYKWNNLNKKENSNFLEKITGLVSNITISNDMKKTSIQFAGEFLAFVLLTRSIFSFQTISLIGIGHGCEIIIHCIEMIYTLNQDIDLISDILFINGKCSVTGPMLVQIEKVITGNVYNVYTSSSKDTIDSYKQNLILGNSEIVYNKWENLDVNHLHLEFTGYEYHLNDIIEKLKFQ